METKQYHITKSTGDVEIEFVRSDVLERYDALAREALDECRKLGIDRVLMVCDKTNIGSARSIMNNGGILENEIFSDGVIEQRYWIDLT